MQIYALFNNESDAAIGGAEIQLFFLAKYLSKRYDINVVTGDWGQGDVERYNDINVIRSFCLKRNIWNYMKAPFLLWEALKKSRADIFIASTSGVEIGFIALFCKIKKKKFIFRTGHDMDCDGEFIKNNFIFGQSYKYGLTNADKVITQSEKNKEQLKDNYNIDAVVIRNSWNISVRENNENFFILWVARCTSWKNPQIFLELANNNPKVKCVMICPVQKNEIELFNKIKNNASKLSNVEFIDFVSFEEIQKYYDKAKLFVNTSDHEGFPNSFVQACLGSTPIVSYKVNPDNFLVKRNVGYFADGDRAKLFELVQDGLKNEMIWKDKSKNCFKYVKKYHDLKKNCRMWDKEINLIIQ